MPPLDSKRIIDRIARTGLLSNDTFVSVNDAFLRDRKLESRTWFAITSSRLGVDPKAHREVCRFVSRCLMDCRRRNAVLLIAIGSAIESWANRAAQLYRVPTIHVSVDVDISRSNEKQARISVDGAASRDHAVIAIADRVDAVYVRRGGTIESCLTKRIDCLKDASTRVAVTSLPKCTGKELVAHGAVGWWAGENGVASVTNPTKPPVVRDIAWIHSDGKWLVHCTRACLGAWPGQTQRQYQDNLLLDGETENRRPIDTLRRILRTERLIANSIVSARRYPVVCFSAAPLAELLISRCYRPHLRRWDYEPYGIAIRHSAASQLGFQPVIYGEDSSRDSLRESDQYRFQAAGKTYDWTVEREWRAAEDVDLKKLARDDVRVFVPTDSEAQAIGALSPWRITAVLEPPPNAIQRV